MTGHVVVTGGAGFIGTNLTHVLLQDGEDVVVIDDLSRHGTRENLAWLRREHGEALHHVQGDVRDPRIVQEALTGARAVHHLAAQVAVTTSLDDPIHDFDVNLRGTLNVLDAARRQREPPAVVFASTNKVYGPLADVPLREEETRYVPEDPDVRTFGFAEDRPLELVSPYGCSKGGADQYVLDHARTFDVPTVSLRMSCVYGPHQHGNVDQGWIAHFLRQARNGGDVTIFGDGKQVRDILHVKDAVDAYRRAARHAHEFDDRAFNLGGGPSRTLSLLELVNHLEARDGTGLTTTFDAWRAADQRYYVSDVRAFHDATGWTPTVGVEEGLESLDRWLQERRLATPLIEQGGGAR